MRYQITPEKVGFLVTVFDGDENVLTTAGVENIGLAYALVTKARTEGWEAIGSKPKAAPKKKG